MTDQEKFAAEIGGFFDDDFLDVSNAIGNGRKVFFRQAPDSAVTSYYEEREQQKITGKDYELDLQCDVSAVSRLLEVLWQSDSCNELCSLCPGIEALATSKVSVSRAQAGEVSPYIYEMF